MIGHAVLTFAKPDALQGSLVDTLKDVRPSMFFAVPRVWEKFEEKLKEFANKSGSIAQSISGWAKEKSLQHYKYQQTHPHADWPKPDSPPTFSYPIARSLILSKIKGAMGLDQTKIFVFSAAPMNKRTQEYFTSLDMPPLGVFGMTETAGSVTTWTEAHLKVFTSGVPISGVHVKIDNPDKDGIGEICLKGRNMFLGYFKNEKATKEVYDLDGYVHSGDLGSLNEGFLEITGRIKELIITAGGENVAPIIIEH